MSDVELSALIRRVRASRVARQTASLVCDYLEAAAPTPQDARVQVAISTLRAICATRRK